MYLKIVVLVHLIDVFATKGVLFFLLGEKRLRL